MAAQLRRVAQPPLVNKDTKTTTIISMSTSTTPPPQAGPPAPPPSTPISTRTRTTDCHSFKFEDRTNTYRRLCNEMSPYFLGPMPPQLFLDTFFPPSDLLCTASPESPRASCFKKGMFSALVNQSRELQMYNAFVCFRTPLFPRLIQSF
jgi:hypothetical protein